MRCVPTSRPSSSRSEAESVEAEPTLAGRGATDLAAIVAPHIDLRRGGGCYAAIYRELARRSKARRFIVLGICHHPTVHRFALCRKDYDTPLGLVKTDRELVDRLAREVGRTFSRRDRPPGGALGGVPALVPPVPLRRALESLRPPDFSVVPSSAPRSTTT